MLIYELSYIVFVILLAKINSDIIARGKKVWHFGNGLLHLIVAGFATAIWWIPAAVIILCNTKVFFDTSLDLFRGMGLNYVSPSPESTIDKIEKKIFGTNAMLPRLIYLTISLSLNIIYFVWVH